MKTAREIIASIPVDAANFGYIAMSGKINGSLLVSLEKAMEEYARQFQSKWLEVNDVNMPKFYENYLLSIDGTVQHTSYRFMGKEVDEVWRVDDSDPAYWFECDLNGDQVSIDDCVLYQPLPQAISSPALKGEKE